MRHISTSVKIGNDGVKKSAVISLDGSVGEYVVKFYLNDKYQKDADYFTDEKEDAISTVHYWMGEY